MGYILVLDDDSISRNSIERSLAHYKKVIALGTDEMSKKKLLDHKYNLIIADYHLNTGDCFSFLQQYRYHLGPVPIFLISHTVSSEILIKAVEEKVYAYLPKPLDIEKLKTKIENFYNIKPDYLLRGRRLVLFHDGWVLEIDDIKFYLTETEFKILKYLLDREDQVIERSELIQYLWGSVSSSRNKLDTHLTNLKNKLPLFKESLETIPRLGFKLK